MAPQLVLPENPTSGDVWLCESSLDAAQGQLERTGIDAGIPLHEDLNPNRVLSEFMLPYMDNLQEVTHALLERAQEAQNLYLRTEQDIEFDHVGLESVVAQIEDLHTDVDWYTETTSDAAEMPADEQRRYLAEFVYMPVFRGGGYAEPGNADSPWEDKTSAWCRPIELGVQLEAATKWHKEKWEKAGKTKPGRWALGSILGLSLLYGAYRVHKALRK